MKSRLLCIDDEPDVAEWVAVTMRLIGDAWDVDGAGSITEGHDRYAAQPADVVLLDLGLPDVDGHPLAALRAVLAWRPEPAVVVLTGANDSRLGLLAVDSGAQDYLDKQSVTPATLAHAADYARRRHASTVRAEAREDVSDERAEALAAYVSSLSHDLRSPLGTVLMLAETVQRVLEDDTIDAATTLAQVTRLTGSLTGLSRRAIRFCDELLADATSAATSREPVDLNALVTDAVQLALAGETDGLSLTIDDLPAGLYGQPASIRQVLVNLLANAARHTPRPGGRLHVHATTDDDRLLLTVEDNGPGIPVEHRDRVFAPGLSGAGSTGLGLATVRRTMERHGGRVWVEDGQRLSGAALVLEFPWRSDRRGDLAAAGHL